MLKNNDFKLYFDLNYSECTGCMACVAVCQRKAIEIKEDSEGFKYPKYSEDKCVGCSMCKKICPSYKINEIKVNDIEDSISLRARLKDDNAIINSTSGGCFMVWLIILYKIIMVMCLELVLIVQASLYIICALKK